MNRPEYYADDETWMAYEAWLAAQPAKQEPPAEFMSGLRAAIQKARGDPADDIPGTIAFLNEASRIICGKG